jgi:hypothetical protein
MFLLTSLGITFLLMFKAKYISPPQPNTMKRNRKKKHVPYMPSDFLLHTSKIHQEMATEI